ncbi:MAG: hypothetical protein ACYDDV_09655 [Methanoregula sp.]
MSVPEISRNTELEQIEQLMENVSKLYFDTILNFIKWNTAISVATILWFGNFIINSTVTLNWNQGIFVIFSLLFLLFSVALSIGIFYDTSKFFNEYWILCAKRRESIFLSNSPRPIPEAEFKRIVSSNKQMNHYQKIPKIAERFDTEIFLQMVMMFLGLGCFLIFIILIKLSQG